MLTSNMTHNIIVVQPDLSKRTFVPGELDNSGKLFTFTYAAILSTMKLHQPAKGSDLGKVSREGDVPIRPLM